MHIKSPSHECNIRGDIEFHFAELYNNKGYVIMTFAYIKSLILKNLNNRNIDKDIYIIFVFIKINFMLQLKLLIISR